MLRLATPLVMGELAWMAMGIVDTMMVGRLPNSAEAIGGVGLASVIFFAIFVLGNGVLFGMDTLASHAFGAGKIEDCHRTLRDAVYLSVALGLALMGVMLACEPILRVSRVNEAVLRQTIPVLNVLIWGTLPLLLYTACRRYLQAMNIVAPVTFAMISANVVNAVLNWVLIYGHWGAPAMGAVGSAWSTFYARIYIAAVLIIYVVVNDRRNRGTLWCTPAAPEWARVRTLLTLGVPAALQFSFEIAVFAVAETLIARLEPVWLAGHRIAINTATLTYMVPLGISSAAAVRVGQALGRGDRHGASTAGWTAVALGAGFMSAAGVGLVLVPHWIARTYTADAAVIAASVTLLRIAAAFQLFDGLQTVTTGALRGTGDTRSPMLAHIFAYWFIGLPIGYTLCFRRGWGAPGMWIGLCIAIILIGLALLAVWWRRARVP
jgi:multidrug resistance protein, MATE family